ncbi:MAG: hypothetical protein ACK5HT_00420 [Draconibacterium sp.]
MANEAIHYAIVGQNEKIIFKRLGAPSSVTNTSDGGKEMLYEYQSKGMFTTPNKSKLTLNYTGDMGNTQQHLNWQYSSASTQTNAPEYTIYQKDISVIKVFLDKEGNCSRIEHNLTKDELEYFYKSFKQFVPQK